MSQPTEIASIHALRGDSLSAVLAGFFGWTLDAFDFFLVALCLPDIAKTFGVPNSKISLTIWMTLATRPIGAFIFGLLADRYGRRRPLILNLLFFSTLSILSGLAPSYSTFVVCRLLFGIGMGGEWGVGASLAMEHAPMRFRGILSGLVQEGYACGNLLASAAYFFVFPHIGWRPLFLLGGVPALLALYVRFGVSESPVWEKTRELNWSRLGSTLLRHWRLFIAITLLLWGMNLCSHGTQDMFPTFLKNQWNLSPHGVAAINAISAVGAIIGGIVVGMLSDRAGRRRAIIGSLALAVVIVPLWAYAPNLPVVIVGAVSDSIHGSRRLGCDSRPHFRAFARFRPRISARICLPMRRTARRQHRLGAITSDESHQLRQCHGNDGHDRFCFRHRRDGAFQRAARNRIRLRVAMAPRGTP